MMLFLVGRTFARTVLMYFFFEKKKTRKATTQTKSSAPSKQASEAFLGSSFFTWAFHRLVATTRGLQ